MNVEIIRECSLIFKQIDFFAQELKNLNISHECQRLCQRSRLFQELIDQLAQCPDLLSESKERSLVNDFSVCLLSVLNFVQSSLDRYQKLISLPQDFRQSDFQAAIEHILDPYYRQSHLKDLAMLTRQLTTLSDKFNLNPDELELEILRNDDLDDLQASFVELITLIMKKISETNRPITSAEKKVLTEVKGFLPNLSAEIVQYLVLMKLRPLSINENKRIQSLLPVLSDAIDQKINEWKTSIDPSPGAFSMTRPDADDISELSQPLLDQTELNASLTIPSLLKILGHPLIVSRFEEEQKQDILSEACLPLESVIIHTNVESTSRSLYLDGELNLQPDFQSCTPKEQILLKFIPDDNIATRSPRLPKYLENEILLLHCLEQETFRESTSYLLSFHGYTVDYRGYYLIFESARYGDLQTFISNYRQSLASFASNKSKYTRSLTVMNQMPLSLLLSVMFDIIAGITFLHQRGIIHGNVMTQNVYVTNQLRCKITDLSIAQQILSKDAPPENQKNSFGLAFIAPEIRMGNTIDFSADIYSYAIICLHLLSLSIPRLDSLTEQIRQAIYHYLQTVSGSTGGNNSPSTSFPEAHHSHRKTSPSMMKQEQIMGVLSKLQGLLLDCSVYDSESSMNQLRPTSGIVKDQIHRLLVVIGGDARETIMTVDVHSSSHLLPSDEQKSLASAFHHPEEEEWKEFLQLLQKVQHEGRTKSTTTRRFPQTYYSPSQENLLATNEQAVIDTEGDNEAVGLVYSSLSDYEDDEAATRASRRTNTTGHRSHAKSTSQKYRKPRINAVDSKDFEDETQGMDDIYQVRDDVFRTSGEEIVRTVSNFDISMKERNGTKTTPPSLQRFSSHGSSGREELSPLSDTSSPELEYLRRLQSNSSSRPLHRFPSIQAMVDKQILDENPNFDDNDHGCMLDSTPLSMHKNPRISSSTSQRSKGAKSQSKPPSAVYPRSHRSISSKYGLSRSLSREFNQDVNYNTIPTLYSPDPQAQWIRFFTEQSLFLHSDTEKYANYLTKHHVVTPKQLKQIIQADDKFLLSIGFEWDDALDMMECLDGLVSDDNSTVLTDSVFEGSPSGDIHKHWVDSGASRGRFPSSESRYNNGWESSPPRMSSRSMSGRSFFASPSMYIRNRSPGIDDPSPPRHFPRNSSSYSLSPPMMRTEGFIPSDISHIYYRAAHCYDTSAKEKLFAAATEGDVLAEGYIMRMYALGQGGLAVNRSTAQKIGNRIFPQLRLQLDTHLHYVRINAQFLIGVCHHEGLGATKDIREAVHYYRDCAQQDFLLAIAMLGSCYYHGLGVEKDLSTAVKWYTIAAEHGHASAQTNLGLLYESGQGVKRKDPAKAVTLYKLASEQGDITADYNLAYCYERGVGITQDLTKALQLYEKAATKGHHAAAQYHLGNFFEEGLVVSKDMHTAFRWYSAAASKQYAPAQCKVGKCYEHGMGIDCNPALAITWYQKSAKQGHAEAEYQLANCYSTGCGLDEPDVDQAIHYYRSAAAKGHAGAQNNLAFFYRKGYGVEKNLTMAVKLYRAAAKQGYPAAQYNLGYCYEKGLGVPKKLHDMIQWYRLAKDNGVTKAAEALQRYWKDYSDPDFL